MNRISICLRFLTRNMIKSTLYFIIIYSVVSLGFFSTIFLTDDKSSSFNSSLYIGSAFFVFIYVISDYRASFNYLLINGNTRKTIFLSTITVNIILSVVLGVLSFVSSFIDELISKSIAGNGRISISMLHLIYPDTGRIFELPFFAALFIMLTSFSMLYGALAYKFGKFFITIYWVCFGLAFMTLPLSTGTPHILVFIKNFLCIDQPNGMLLASVNFIIAALIFGAAAYLISSRQQQTAPAA